MNGWWIAAALGGLEIVSAVAVSCRSRTQSARATPESGASATTGARAATNSAGPVRPLAKGDKVVSTPVAVMEIAGIGPRSSFVNRDSDNVVLDVEGTLRDGSSPIKTVPVDDEIVYGLRFVGEERIFEMISLATAHKVGLRRVVDKKTAEAMLVQARGGPLI